MGAFAGLGAWLVAWIPTLVARVLVSLGITIVSLVGIDAALTSLLNMIETNVNTLNGDVLNLLVVSGIKQGLGIVIGAALMKFSLWTMSTGARMLFRNLS